MCSILLSIAITEGEIIVSFFFFLLQLPKERLWFHYSSYCYNYRRRDYSFIILPSVTITEGEITVSFFFLLLQLPKERL